MADTSAHYGLHPSSKLASTRLRKDTTLAEELDVADAEICLASDRWLKMTQLVPIPLLPNHQRPFFRTRIRPRKGRSSRATGAKSRRFDCPAFVEIVPWPNGYP